MIASGLGDGKGPSFMKRLRTLPTSFEILLSPLFQGNAPQNAIDDERKRSSAVRRLVIGNVRSHARMLGAIDALLVEAVVLHDQQIAFGMTAGRGRDDERVRRAAEHRIDDIKFGTGRSATDQAEIAELLVVGDALECPRDAGSLLSGVRE